MVIWMFAILNKIDIISTALVIIKFYYFLFYSFYYLFTNFPHWNLQKGKSPPVYHPNTSASKEQIIFLLKNSNWNMICPLYRKYKKTKSYYFHQSFGRVHSGHLLFISPYDSVH